MSIVGVFLDIVFPGNRVKIEQGLFLTFVTERPSFVFKGVGQFILLAESICIRSIA